MEKTKRKLPKWSIILIVLIIVFGIIGIVAYSQWNNIEALIVSQKYTSEERENLQQENDKAVNNILEAMPEVEIAPMTEELEKLIAEGKITEDEAVGVMIGNIKLEDILAKGEQKSEEVKEETPANQDYVNSKAKLDELIAKIYVLKASFIGQIEGLIEQAKNEYVSSKGKIKKATLVGRYMGKGKALEKKCDAQIANIIAQIKVELEKTGGDIGLVDQIQKAYENEKSLKKAELVDRYS